MTPHTALCNQIRAELSKGMTRLWANPRGVAVLSGGAHIEYGLAPGASDLIGVHRGKFVAIEVKTGRGRPSDQQVLFLDCVIAMGGLAGVARSVDDARRILAGGQSG